MRRNKKYTLEVFGDKDEITIQELYDYFGIDADNKPYSDAWRRRWINNWKDQVLPLHGRINNRRRITKFHLAEEGKKELGRGGKNSLSANETLPASDTLGKLLESAQKWVTENPERRVTLEFEPEDGVFDKTITIGKK